MLERRSRDYVLGRIRAGVLETGTVALLDEAKVGGRLHRECLVHEGIELSFEGARHRIDFADLTGGKSVTIYGQTEITRDLMDALADDGVPPRYEAEVVEISDIEGTRPPRGLPRRRRPARNHLRVRGRMRRLSRDQPQER